MAEDLINNKDIYFPSYLGTNDKLINLIDELGWDYQCMTCGGRETYDKLMQMLGIIEPDEVYMEI